MNSLKKLIFGLLTLLLSACNIGPTPTPQPPAIIATAPNNLPAAETSVPAADLNPTLVPRVDTFPAPEAYQWQVAAEGFNQPLDIQNAGDGSNRLFIVEREGKIRIIEHGQLLDKPFLDIGSKLSTDNSEQGLLGLAFHPNYAENGLFFLNYTDEDGNTVIARYQVSGNANQAEIASETVLLHIGQPYANHNGGGIAFGPDGFLYIGLGDGGWADDPKGNGQNLETFLGAILRIDVDGGERYVVPADNPFVKEKDALPEIWAYGLRNPWRFSFDSLTGDLYIGDVGQNIWEEIDFLPAGAAGGANFGWNYMEATHIFTLEPPESFGLVAPVAEYHHDQGCSVTGGLVVRDPLLPAWQGIYLYGDFCEGTVWGLLRTEEAWRSIPLFRTGARISTFGEGEEGGVYLADYEQGKILQLGKK